MKSDQLHVFSVPASIQATLSSSTMMDRWAVSRIQRAVAGARIAFELWDGSTCLPGRESPVATVVFRTRHALLAWLWDAEMNFGEAYMAGEVEIRGDLVELLSEVYRTFGRTHRRAWWLRANDRGRAKANVHHHYDLGNPFYAYWLDRELVYTCAYFPTRNATLEEAQAAKMDLLCRKLRLRPGDRVIEAGCGWGALALHMARQYGATVRAFNLSAEQIAYARDRARLEGLDDRVDFVEDDYRNAGGTCDAFVSVGMLEHVGLPDYPTLGRVIDRVLTPDGRGLLHFIGRNVSAPLNPWICKRIFPGAYPPTLREVCGRVLEPYDFSVLDVENLRLHYADTIEHWRARFEAHRDAIARMFDDPFVRAWRLYLAGSQVAFTTGSMQLFQVVFSRGTSNQVPWTRRDA